MKKVFKKLVVLAFYCSMYVSIVNISSSLINNSFDTINFEEIFSIDGMRSGQKDIYTFIKLKIKKIDVDAIQKEIFEELEKSNFNQ